MWKYLGSGEFLPGVPARDLTDEEAAPFLKDVEASPLYEKVAPKRGRKVGPTAKSAEDK